jgi:hypothetical protein
MMNNTISANEGGVTRFHSCIMSIMRVVLRVVAVAVVVIVFNERVQQSKNYIMKTKSNELRATPESPTSDSTYATVAKRASFRMESDFRNST